jgi:hypothetical protein
VAEVASTRSPQSLVDIFAAVLPDDPRIERRKIYSAIRWHS